MDLSPEDALRLNVLLANKPQAIRIDESRMTVYGLSDKGEAEVPLNPTGRDEQYIKRVKELLSGHVLGSPGGYPVYLQRWTRMGQMRDESLEQLLLLGEPEAVVAAVCAQGLTDELARRAWWAMEDSENARRMLTKQAVVEGEMGPRLAAYLVEHLAFETEAEQMMVTVSLVLQPGLIDEALRAELWKKAQRKNVYYVGFLSATPDDIPEPAPAHPLWEQHREALQQHAAQGAALAGLAARVLAPAGQAYLDTLLRVLKKPGNQDVVNTTLDAVADYFAAARPEGKVDQTLDELLAEAESWRGQDTQAAELAVALPQLAVALGAMRVLSGLSYGVVRPVFRDSTAIGSLMRRKLEPLMTPLLATIAHLYGGRVT
jgi:hypothetical protein